jgi:hypothetical protein
MPMSNALLLLAWSGKYDKKMKTQVNRALFHNSLINNPSESIGS